MSRTLTEIVESAFSSANVPLLAFVELEFDSGTVRLTNAAYNIAWDGETWLGLGRLGSIGDIQETAGVEAHGVSLRLSGVQDEHIALALAEDYQGRPCKIYAAPLGSASSAMWADEDWAGDDWAGDEYTLFNVLSDPVLVFQGRMDEMPIELGKTAEIALTAQSRLADLERPRVRRYNDSDQQDEYPGDLGLQFAEAMVEKQLLWGKS